MNVLHLARLCPYPATNGRERRVWETTKTLSDHGDVWLATPASDIAYPADGVHHLPLSSKLLDSKLAAIYAWNASLIFGHSNPYHRAVSKRIVDATDAAGDKFDLVVSESPQLRHAAMNLADRPGTSLLVNKHNSNFELLDAFLASSPAPGVLQERAVDSLRRFEQASINAADAVVFQSNLDHKQFNVPPDTHCAIIPNGTDYDDVRAGGDPEAVRRDLNLPTKDPVCVFIGSYDYGPNAAAAAFVDEQLAPELPVATFVVAGRNPPEKNSPNVVTPGFVEDLPGLLSLADLALCPLFSGSGTKLKMLDYLAAGLPIVTTPVGTQGLPLVDGESALVATNASAFVDAIRRLLDSPELADQIRSNGWNLAAEFDWDRLLSDYDDLLAEL